MKKRDTLSDLEALHFKVTMRVQDIAAVLAPLLRTQRVLYRAIIAAHSKEANRLLCQLLAAENAPRGRVKKGAKHGSP
jgi:hypothetical protein